MIRDVFQEIARFYRYFFFRTYAWRLARGPKDSPEISALWMVVLVIYSNLLAAILAAMSFFRLSIAISSAQARIGGVVLGLPIFFLLYFLWLSNSRYLSFEAEFAGESESEKKRRKMILIVYSVISGFLPILIALLGPRWPRTM